MEGVWRRFFFMREINLVLQRKRTFCIVGFVCFVRTLLR